MMGWGGSPKGPGNGAPSRLRLGRNSSHGKPTVERLAKSQARRKRLAALEDLIYSIAMNKAAKDQDRLKAAEALMNRWEGMPVARNVNANVAVGTAAHPYDLSRLSNAQLATLSKLLGVEVVEPPALPEPLTIEEDKS